MIVCAIDDLMFSIKVSTAAKALKADVYFERAADKVLSTIREKQPSLVVFDLNSRRLQPLEALAAMQADPELARVRTLGFVSHVDAATIDAARAAGCGQVLARSAFVDRLAEILSNA